MIIWTDDLDLLFISLLVRLLLNGSHMPLVFYLLQ